MQPRLLLLAVSCAALLASAQTLRAQHVVREWELGPTWRYGGGSQLGPELRRSLRIARRLDVRVGGIVAWTVDRPLPIGITSRPDQHVDGRHQLFVASAGADARVSLIAGRLGGLYLLGGVELLAIHWGDGIHHHRVNGNARETDLRGRLTIQPSVNAGAAIELARHLSLEARVEFYDDPAPMINGALRLSLRRRW